jgi:hypothetical protein
MIIAPPSLNRFSLLTCLEIPISMHRNTLTSDSLARAHFWTGSRNIRFHSRPRSHRRQKRRRSTLDAWLARSPTARRPPLTMPLRM